MPSASKNSPGVARQGVVRIFLRSMEEELEGPLTVEVNRTDDAQKLRSRSGVRTEVPE